MEQAVYRIIDANFNRAREAVRLMEDFCRFALNCQTLTARAKQLRHQLCDSLSKLDAAKLIANRDTNDDVGVGQSVENQLRRTNLRDCFTAAAKRLTEALRAVAEAAQTIDPSVAATVEKIRYQAYTLEKDIAVFSGTNEKFKHVQLYVIISSCDCREVLSLVKDCSDGGADCIQLRAKGLADNELLKLAAEFVKTCKKTGVISIINDRVDIAVAAGANGVHLGQNDLDIAQAQKLCLSPLIIGKSTHNAEQLEKAVKDGATYVGLGPVFATKTKPDAKTAGLEYLKKAVYRLQGCGISGVAIGGITTKNAEQVMATGVNALAVCSAVSGAEDIIMGCADLKTKINALEK